MTIIRVLAGHHEWNRRRTRCFFPLNPLAKALCEIAKKGSLNSEQMGALHAAGAVIAIEYRPYGAGLADRHMRSWDGRPLPAGALEPGDPPELPQDAYWNPLGAAAPMHEGFIATG